MNKEKALLMEGDHPLDTHVVTRISRSSVRTRDESGAGKSIHHHHHRTHHHSRKYFRRMAVLVLAAVLLFAMALVLFIAMPVFAKQRIDDLIPIVNPSGILFRVWQDNFNYRIDITRSFYYFNLTNPWEVFNNYSLPNYHKVGPFVYVERTYNPISSIFWAANTSIGFNYNTSLYFDQERSVDPNTGEYLDPDKVNITNINVPLMAAAYRLNYLPNIPLKPLVCALVNGEVGKNVVGDSGIFTVRTARQMIEGYKDPVWSILSENSAAIDYSCPSIFRINFNGSQPVPSNYTFASGQKCPMWDDQSICNSSTNQVTYSYSGATWNINSKDGESEGDGQQSNGGLDVAGQYTQWAGQSELWWWGESGDCRKIEGSNGLMYSNGLTTTSRPYLYVDQLFRKLQLEFQQKVKVKGIETLRYIIAKSELDFSPNSECYYQKYRGVLNLSVPYFGPLYVTKPLYQSVPADQPIHDSDVPDLPQGRHLLNFTVDGVHITEVDRELQEYETYTDILTVTGTLLEGSARLQTSTWMKPIFIRDCPGVFTQFSPKNVTQTINGKTRHLVNEPFPYTFVPMFYVDRHAAVSNELANLIKDKVLLPFVLFEAFGGVCVGLGVICAGLALILLFFHVQIRRRENKERLKEIHEAHAPIGSTRQSEDHSRTPKQIQLETDQRDSRRPTPANSQPPSGNYNTLKM